MIALCLGAASSFAAQAPCRVDGALERCERVLANNEGGMTVQYFLPGVSFDDGDEFFELLMAVLHDLDDMSGGFVETDYEESASQIKTRFSDEDETTHITAWEDFVARLRYVEATAPDAKSPQFRRGFSAGLNSYPFLLPCIGPCSQDRQSRPSKTPCVP